MIPTDIATLLPVAGLALFVAIGALAWLRAAGRHPCPHCGRRSSRVVQAVESSPAGLALRSLVYRCRSCGGALRYARHPNGREYWEAADGPPAALSGGGR